MVRTLLLSSAFALAASAASAAITLVSESTWVDFGGHPTVGARYKGDNPGNTDHYVGEGNLGSGAVRTEEAFTIAGDTAFTFSFDGSTGIVSSSVGGAPAISYTSPHLGNVGKLGFLLFNQPRGSDTDRIGVTGLTVNGEAAGDLSCDAGERCWWSVGGLSSTQSLTVTGTITPLDFGANSQIDYNERIKFEVTAGVSPVPIPPAIAAGLLALSGLGLYRRRQRSTV